MSLGAGALKVSRVPDTISHKEIFMATLERWNQPNKLPLTSTVSTYLKEYLS